MVERPSDEFSEPVAQGREDPRAREPGDVAAPRRRRRGALAALGVVALLLAATGALLHAQERERRTPEAAVTEYVRLIEEGDVEAATALVPVPGGAPGVQDPPPPPPSPSPDLGPGTPITVEIIGATERLRDDRLLTNASYAANDGITDVTVEPAEPGAATAVGETTEIVVGYAVRDIPSSTVLRVERLPDTFPGLPAWEVRDSLTVPLVVRLDELAGPVAVDGVEVVASGAPYAGHAQSATMLYPGLYTVTFDGGTYLEASDVRHRVAASRGPSPADGADPSTATVNVIPSQAAYDRVLQESRAFLDACADRSPAVDLAVCPEAYRAGADTGGTTAFTEGFTRVSIALMRGATADGEAVPLVNGTVEGSVVHPTPTGRTNATFIVVVEMRLGDGEPDVEVYTSPAG